MKLTDRQEGWLITLESGNYHQVDGFLKGFTEDGELGYCCLGVYCDIDEDTKWTISVVRGGRRRYEMQDELGYSSDTELTGRVVARLGLRSCQGDLKAPVSRINGKWYAATDDDIPDHGEARTHHWSTSLASMNDSGLFSFDDIAEFIRARPELVFEKGAE